MTQQHKLPQHIDSTMMNCFRACPRKYYNEFCLGLRPPGISIDLHAGACLAAALDQTYKSLWAEGRPLSEALLIAEACFFQLWGDVEAPEWKNTAKTKDRVWEAVESYFDTYPPLTDHVRPYISASGKPMFEYTFAIPLEDEGYFPLHPETQEPFVYCGRFDMLGAYRDRPCVRDEKTTGSSIGRNWASSWDLRSQFIGYVWACQQAGIDLDTVVVRGLAIQKTQFVHAEAIKVYSQDLIQKWYLQLARDMHRLVKCWEEDYFDYNLGDSCTSYGHCPFMSACASPTPENWFTEFEVRYWNPLDRNRENEVKNAVDSP